MEARIAELWAVLSWYHLAVWVVVPLLSFVYVQFIKVSARESGNPYSRWQLIAISAGAAFAMASFVGWMAEWPLHKAFQQAVAVSVALPVLAPFLLRKLAKKDPEAADDLGYDGVPTQYRIDDDTTEPKP